MVLVCLKAVDNKVNVMGLQCFFTSIVIAAFHVNSVYSVPAHFFPTLVLKRACGDKWHTFRYR